jgi:uncharacterized protein (DUF2062 family)
MTATNLSLPVDKRKALMAAVTVLFGAGLMIGYVGGELAGLIGAVIAFFGFFYVYTDYQRQKKARKQQEAATK